MPVLKAALCQTRLITSLRDGLVVGFDQRSGHAAR